MLVEVARLLDDWAVEQDLDAQRDGSPRTRACTIRVLGQSALLEAQLPLKLATTVDVDVAADYSDSVRREFERLLRKRGRELEPLGREIWMPRETRYAELYAGRFVRLLLADPESVLVSKGLKAPAKNSALLTEYLASGASRRFLTLAKKYGLNLEQFL